MRDKMPWLQNPKSLTPPSLAPHNSPVKVFADDPERMGPGTVSNVLIPQRQAYPRRLSAPLADHRLGYGAFAVFVAPGRVGQAGEA